MDSKVEQRSKVRELASAILQIEQSIDPKYLRRPLGKGKSHSSNLGCTHTHTLLVSLKNLGRGTCESTVEWVFLGKKPQWFEHSPASLPYPSPQTLITKKYCESYSSTFQYSPVFCEVMLRVLASFNNTHFGYIKKICLILSN